MPRSSSGSDPFDRLSLDMYLTLMNLDLEWRKVVATCTDAVARLDAKERCVEMWRGPLRARLDALFGALSVELEGLSPDERRAAITFHRRLVLRYFLQSPFCRTTLGERLDDVDDGGLIEGSYAGVECAPTPLGALLGAYTIGSAHGYPWGRPDGECGEVDRPEERGRRTG